MFNLKSICSLRHTERLRMGEEFIQAGFLLNIYEYSKQIKGGVTGLLKSALLIEDHRGIEVFRILQQSTELAVIGLADLSGDLSWLTDEERRRYFITTDLARIGALPELEAVVSLLSRSGLSRLVKENLPDKIDLVEVPSEGFLMALLRSQKDLLENRLLKGELLAILNSVQDAIEVVDAKGVVKYINPAFTRVTGIPDNKRVNQNIFEVSPHGALAQSLIQQKPVTGYRTYVGGSDAEVISNASPIIVDGQIKGAVVVFQPIHDILKLIDQLNYSNTVIENLYTQIGQISGSHWTFDDLISQSKVFLSAVDLARKAARGDAPVLLFGESGSGKGVFAQAIHNYSPRRGRPLITFDCSAVPEALQEVELFGCEKGIQAGVIRTRLGKIELARGGTLYLKEITALSLYLQDKLAGLLKEKFFLRIGGEKQIASDVRLITSANYDLKKALRKGILSEELYQELGGVELALPPLNKRVEDLPLLANQLVQRYNRKMGKRVQGISPKALQALAGHDWPGNISELKNIMERAMAMVDGPNIEYQHLAPYIGKLSGNAGPVSNEIIPLDKMEQIMLKQALTCFGETLEGKKKAARALNISLATLYNKLKKYQLNL